MSTDFDFDTDLCIHCQKPMLNDHRLDESVRFGEWIYLDTRWDTYKPKDMIAGMHHECFEPWEKANPELMPFGDRNVWALLEAYNSHRTPEETITPENRAERRKIVVKDRIEWIRSRGV